MFLKILPYVHFRLKIFHSGLSTKEKKFSRGFYSTRSDVWYLGKLKKKVKIPGYNRILGLLILLEMHVEKITLNESHWAVHIFGKIYFKDGFN